jgi:hypothetical protein
LTKKLAAEKPKKFRVEFVWFSDDSWGLLLAHWPWATSGWAFATDDAAFDGGKGLPGRGAERWEVRKPARVPAAVRVSFAEDVKNWRALADGRIRDEKWYTRMSERSRKRASQVVP